MLHNGLAVFISYAAEKKLRCEFVMSSTAVVDKLDSVNLKEQHNIGGICDLNNKC